MRGVTSQTRVMLCIVFQLMSFIVSGHSVSSATVATNREKELELLSRTMRNRYKRAELYALAHKKKRSLLGGVTFSGVYSTFHADAIMARDTMHFFLQATAQTRVKWADVLVATLFDIDAHSQRPCVVQAETSRVAMYVTNYGSTWKSLKDDLLAEVYEHYSVYMNRFGMTSNLSYVCNNTVQPKKPVPVHIDLIMHEAEKEEDPALGDEQPDHCIEETMDLD